MLMRSRSKLSHFLILVIFLVCIISFFGCGSDSDTDDADSATDPATEDPPIENTDPPEITRENDGIEDVDMNVPFQPTEEEPLAPPAQPAEGSDEAPAGELSFVVSVSGQDPPVTLQDGISVPVGGSMSVQCTIVNNTDETIIISFVTGQKLDVIITSPDGDEVFVWSRGRRFLQVVNAITLDQGGSWSHELTVPIGDGENALPTGSYNMMVIVTGSPELKLIASDMVIFH